MCTEHSMHSRGSTQRHQHGGMGDVTVEILGMALYISKAKRVVLVDARKPRKSKTKANTIIPGHYSFIAFEPGTYQAPRGVKPSIAFDYDLAGDGQDERYEAFVLDRHRVTFENMDNQGGFAVQDGLIASMSKLAGDLGLKDRVVTGEAAEVLGSVDLSGASLVRGEAHGIHSAHPLTIGDEDENFAEKICAHFTAGRNTPRVVLTEVEGQKLRTEFNLVGNGPWTIMIANIPVEEVMDLNMIDPGTEVPLTHCELIYDLYKETKVMNIPTCKFHHPAAATAEGHCGPPFRT
jgi:hypothetical protein